MSLDVSLIKTKPTEIFSANITHNLNEMADAAGIYKYLWRPDECEDVSCAGDLIEPLTTGLAKMKANPDKFKELDAPNGWGTYKDFVPWIDRYLAACIADPDATIEVCR